MARPRSTTAPAPASAPATGRRAVPGTVPQPGHPTRTRRGREPALPPSPAPPATGAGRAGFVLYVGLSEDDAGGPGAADLAEVAEALRDLAQDLLPAAETFTALSLVPGTGSDDVQTLRARLAALRPLDAAPGTAGTTSTAGTASA